VVNPSRRSVAPVRKLVAAVLGTIAVFVMLFGLGMTSWPIVALGAAMLALAIGLTLVNVVRRGGRAWVSGTAHVVSVSEPPPSSVFGRCELQLIVAAPGLQASRIKVRDPRVPVAKWPDAGSTLPVMIAVDDMRHVRIQWDDVMTHTEAMEEPQTYADPMRDLAVDDLLPEPEAPPWVTRDRQQWPRSGGDDTDPVTADLTGQLGDLRERTMAAREAPAKPIVLEGTLVDTEARSTTLPRRPKPSPYPRTTSDSAATSDAPATAAAAAAATDPGAATTTAPEPAATEPAETEPVVSDVTAPVTADADAEPVDAPAEDAGPDAGAAATAPPAPPEAAPDLPAADSPEAAPDLPAADSPEPADPRDLAGPDPELDLALDGTDSITPETPTSSAESPAGSAAVSPTESPEEPPEESPDERPVITGVDQQAEEDGAAAAAAGAGASAAGAAVTGAAAAGAAGAAAAGAAAAAAAADRTRADVATDNRIDELITAYPSARPGPAGAIHGVGITILVTDLERSTRFYRDMLGFFEIDKGDGSAVLASGDTRVVLRTVHELSPSTGRLIYLNLEVGDVEAVYGELRAKGVDFVHGPRAVNRGDRLELWAASFHDPDKHNIAITQWRAVG
jgi:catechol 2,3-dioxygenase-like lactoylglutathione lyase family enzyme